MNGFKNCRACVTEVRCAQLDRCLEQSGEIARYIPTGPLPVVGSGGVVGLLRDDLIAVMSHVHDESIKAGWARDEYSHNRQRTQAAEARGRQRALSEVYTKLVEILVAENVRQQQPNEKAQPRP